MSAPPPPTPPYKLAHPGSGNDNVAIRIGAADAEDDPGEMVLRKNAMARAARQEDDYQYKLERINQRVSDIFSRYSHMADTKTEFVDDADELLGALNDPIQRKKYEDQMTVVVIGVQRNLDQKTRALSSLNEFFTSSLEAMKEDPDFSSSSDIWDEGEVEDVSHLAVDARSQLSSATQRLQDINMSYSKLLRVQQAFPDNKRGRKKLEKALIIAQEEVEALMKSLVAVREELRVNCTENEQLVSEGSRMGMELASLKQEIKDGQAVSTRLKSTEAELQTVRLKLKTAEEKAKAGGQGVIDELKGEIEELQLDLQAERQSREAFREAIQEDHTHDLDELRAEYEGKLRIVQEQRDHLDEKLHAFIEATDVSEQPSTTSLDMDMSDRETPAPDVDEAMEARSATPGKEDSEHDEDCQEAQETADDTLSQTAGDEGAEKSPTPTSSADVRVDETEELAIEQDQVEPDDEARQVVSVKSPIPVSRPPSTSNADLKAMVESLEQKLAAERDKVQSGKKRLAVVKVQLASSEMIRSELEEQLQAVVEASKDEVAVESVHIGSQFPSHAGTPVQFPSHAGTPVASTTALAAAEQQLGDDGDEDALMDTGLQAGSLTSVHVVVASPTPPLPGTPPTAPPSPDGISSPKRRGAMPPTPAGVTPRSKSAVYGRSRSRQAAVAGSLATKSYAALTPCQSMTRGRSAKYSSDRQLASVSVVRGSQVTVGSDGALHRIGIDIPLYSASATPIAEQLGMSQESLTQLLLDEEHPIVKEIVRIKNAIDRMKYGIADVLKNSDCDDAAKALRDIPIAKLQTGMQLEMSVHEIRLSILTVLDQLHRSISLALESYPVEQAYAADDFQKAEYFITELTEENDILKEHITELKKVLQVKDDLLDGKLGPEQAVVRQQREIEALQSTILSLRTELQRKRLEQMFLPMEQPLNPRKPINTDMLYFTRQDAKSNESSLYKGVFEKRINPEEYAEMVLAMREYNRLPVERLQILAQRRLLWEAIERNRVYVESELPAIWNVGGDQVARFAAPAVKAINSVLERQDRRLARESAEVVKSRHFLGKVLSEKMIHLEEDTGLLLIKPAVASAVNAATLQIHEESLAKMRVPSRTALSRASFGDVSLPQAVQPGTNFHSGLGAPPPTAQGHHQQPDSGTALRVVPPSDQQPRRRAPSKNEVVGTAAKLQSKHKHVDDPKLWSPEMTLPGQSADDASVAPHVMTTLIDLDRKRFDYEFRLMSVPNNSAAQLKQPGQPRLRQYKSLVRPGQGDNTSTGDIFRQARNEAMARQDVNLRRTKRGSSGRHIRSITLPPLPAESSADRYGGKKVAVMRGKKLLPP